MVPVFGNAITGKAGTMKRRRGVLAVLIAASTLAFAMPGAAQTQRQRQQQPQPQQQQPQQTPPGTQLRSKEEEKIENPVAVFAALDKVTARIKPLSISIDSTERFGALKVTPRVCYTRPPTEPPLTSAFVEVDEVKLNGEETRIFTGWMFAQSPGLHAVEHPVFDVWLTNCRTKSGEASGESE